jgi:hypothetical protein
MRGCWVSETLILLLFMCVEEEDIDDDGHGHLYNDNYNNYIIRHLCSSCCWCWCWCGGFNCFLRSKKNPNYVMIILNC